MTGPRTSPDGARALALRTRDGVRLAAEVLAGPAGEPTWVVLAHGFTVSTRTPAVRRVAERLSRRATVLLYDARGHGRSGGRSTLGDREVLDVDAAVLRARAEGAGRVVTLGFSMGAAAVVRHAAAVAPYAPLAAPDAVVAVSGTGPWSTRATASPAMRRLHLLVETGPGRLVARLLLRTRVDPQAWPEPPPAPEAVAGDVGVPLLLVHGDRDRYLGLEHARALADTSGAPLWVEAGLGHAEVAMTPALVDRLAAALVDPAPGGAGAPGRRLGP